MLMMPTVSDLLAVIHATLPFPTPKVRDFSEGSQTREVDGVDSTKFQCMEISNVHLDSDMAFSPDIMKKLQADARLAGEWPDVVWAILPPVADNGRKVVIWIDEESLHKIMQDPC